MLFASGALVDEQIHLVVAHRVVKVDGLHLPAVAFKLVDDHRKSYSLVGGFITTKSNSVVVDDSLILVVLNDT